MMNANVIEHSGDDGIDDLFDCLRAGVKKRICWKDCRPGEHQ
jgi:hypothetical protein